MPMTEFAAANGEAIADAPDALPQMLDARSFADLDLELIVERRYQPRTIFDEGALQELADDIARRGVLQPILVRPLPPDRLQDTFETRPAGQRLPEFEIVAGARRFRASRLAGFKSIPVLIRSLDNQQAAEACLVENLQREGLTELEEAEGYAELVETTGVAKEEIGAKIHKSRSYVYGRMKLLDLTVTPREALRKGEIDASRALLIARIPDEKLQLDALTAAAEKDHEGNKRLSYRAFQTWVQQNVMLKLATAVFPIEDATLVPAAGPCPACPKRTGAAPELFADVDGPDVCTDPKCFHGKEEAHRAALLVVARAKGARLIEGREAKEIKPVGTSVRSMKGYAAVDERVDINGQLRPLRDLLSEKELRKSLISLVDPETQTLIDVVTNEIAGNAMSRARNAAQPASSKAKASSARKQNDDTELDAEKEREALELEYQRRWRTAAISELRPRVVAGEIGALSANLMRRIMMEISGADQRCTEEDAMEAVGLGDGSFNDDLFGAAVRTAPDTDIGTMVLTVLLMSDSIARARWSAGKRTIDPSAPVIEEISALLSVDLDGIKLDVQHQIRAERAQVDTSGEALAAQPEGGAKGKKSKARPAAPAKRPSKEKVQASIATAMRELDAGPEGAVGDEAHAAPKTPAATNAASGAESEISISDRVTVSDVKYSQHGKEGTVTRLEAKGRLRITFDGESDAVLPLSALTLVAKSLWPFPDSDAPRPPSKPPLQAGQRVKVRGAMSGYAAEHHDKEGTLKNQVDGTTKWVVNLARPKKAPKLVELEAEVLEVLA